MRTHVLDALLGGAIGLAFLFTLLWLPALGAS